MTATRLVTAPLSAEMRRALQRALKNGAVFAGSEMDERGSLEMHSASAIRALERRGLVTVQISPDGGLMARPTQLATESALKRSER